MHIKNIVDQAHNWCLGIYLEICKFFVKYILVVVRSLHTHFGLLMIYLNHLFELISFFQGAVIT